MNVTVCEISDREDFFLHDWVDLNQHLMKNKSTLLLMPDLAFFEWTGYDLLSSEHQLEAGLQNQASWLMQLERLQAEYVVYSKLIVDGERYFKACFLFDMNNGHKMIRKVEIIRNAGNDYRLLQPLTVAECALLEIKGYQVGIVLDTELWTTSIADHLSKSGIDILLCPRASSKESVEQWIRQGQTMAVLSGAYCLSSNKTRVARNNFNW